MFKTSLISRRSGISLPPSLIHLFFTYLFWFGDIISGKTILRRSAKDFEINFTSTLSKKIGCQFWMYLSSHRFFSINFTTGCFCDALSCFTLFLSPVLHSKLLYETLSLVHHFLVIYYFPYFVMQWTVLFRRASRIFRGQGSKL